jgi:DNA ligase-1
VETGAPESQLSVLVDASRVATETRSRLAKVQALADALRTVTTDDLPAAVGMLTGDPRQGRLGVGWATVAELAVSPAPVSSLTVGEVDRVLDQLAAVGGSGSQLARRTLLERLLSLATADEGDFLRRLLLGELRQGALEGLMVDAVARALDVPLDAVRRAAMLTGDLGATALLARSGGVVALRAVGLLPLRAVSPMLAGSAPSVADAIAVCGPSSVEWKLDGARVQAHRDGDEVRLFTRNLNDITDRLPGVVAVVRALPARRLVLDGEVLGLDDDARPELFQHTMSRFGSDAPTSGPALSPFFFDVLHVDGDDLLDRPLSERLAALDLVVPEPHRVPRIVTDDAAEAESMARRALDTGHEGVMVKALDSAYDAGRRGKAWRKVKPVHTLDLAVLAAEWGSGRRRGWLSNLHLGARDPAGGFVMVGKTFKGLTDELLQWQTAALLDRKVADEGHIVWVRPELVVEIALDGVQASRRYPGGVALRFARVRRYRDDKSPLDADLIGTVQAMLPGAGHAQPR